MLKLYTFWKDFKFKTNITLSTTPLTINYLYFIFTIQYSNITKLLPIISNLLITSLFVRKQNFNKLYLNNNYLFLTPGIVLKYNNLFKKNLKNKTNTWSLFFLMFAKITNFTLSWQLINFFINQNKIIRFLQKFNLLHSFIFINFFKKQFTLKFKTIRRIKKWVKKKYFKINF